MSMKAKPKRIYISGQISGRSLADAVAQFNDAADAIREAGNIPVNPIDMAFWRLSWNTYMIIAHVILFFGEIDQVYMLSGWEHSRGATLERCYAQMAGIPVSYQK